MTSGLISGREYRKQRNTRIKQESAAKLGCYITIPLSLYEQRELQRRAREANKTEKEVAGRLLAEVLDEERIR